MTRDAVFSGTTAARLLGMPLPLTMIDDTLEISVPTGGRAPRGRFTRGRQVELTAADLTTAHGLNCTSAARTFCDLAVTLDLADLVAAGDHLVRRDGGSSTIPELRDAEARLGPRRGRRRLRRALDLLDTGSESPKESELRVLLIESGFARPECNIPIRDGRGRFVARVDLAYRDAMIAIEYEGDHHRDRKQWRADLARRRRLEALGWTYITVTQADLDDPTAFLADLVAAVSRVAATRRITGA